MFEPPHGAGMEPRRGLAVLVHHIDAVVWVDAGHLRLVPGAVALVPRLHLHPLLELAETVRMVVPAPAVAAGAAEVAAAGFVVRIVLVTAAPL